MMLRPLPVHAGNVQKRTIQGKLVPSTTFTLGRGFSATALTEDGDDLPAVSGEVIIPLFKLEPKYEELYDKEWKELKETEKVCVVDGEFSGYVGYFTLVGGKNGVA